MRSTAGRKLISLFLVLVIALIATRAASAQQAADGADGASINNDISKPIHRLDYFLEYMRAVGGADTLTPKIRYERPFDLYNSWKLALRVEFSAVSTNDAGGSNPPGAFVTGLGDTQFQGVLSKEFDARQGAGFGVRFWAPTASGDEFGNGRWRMAPTVGYRYSLPELSKDSYVQLVARYQFDFAGDPKRSHSSNLQLGPTLNIAFADGLSFALFPSTDIRYNFMTREWFVPFNFEIAKQWNKYFLTGLEVGVPLFDTASPLYKFKIEGHIALRF